MPNVSVQRRPSGGRSESHAAGHTGPAVTVIVPVFNGIPWLEETMGGLLQQSLQDIEILAIDDGSTDSSLAFLRSIKDERVRIVTQPNRGLCATLNRGVELAAAPRVARNDQDDVSLPERLARQCGFLDERAGAACVFSGYAKFGAARVVRHEFGTSQREGEAIRYDPERHGCIVHSTLLCDRDALLAVGGYRSTFYPADDWDLSLRLAERFDCFVLPDLLVRYRLHSAANTYPQYARMRERSRWAEHSAGRRRAGLPELDLEAFRRVNEPTLRSRLRHRRKDGAKLRLRMAGESWLDGNVPSTLRYAVLGGIMDPWLVARRFKSFFNGRLAGVFRRSIDRLSPIR